MCLPCCVCVSVEEAELLVWDCVSIFGDDVPDLVAYFCLCWYFLRSSGFLVCCIFQEVFVERSLDFIHHV